MEKPGKEGEPCVEERSSALDTMGVLQPGLLEHVSKGRVKNSAQLG